MTFIRRPMGIARLFNEIFDNDIYFPEVTSWTCKGRWVDDDKFNITPKPAYYETLIRRKQEAIDALDRQHENEEKYYKETRKRLKEEKETLLRERDKKK